MDSIIFKNLQKKILSNKTGIWGCSWKGQLEKPSSSKLLSWKVRDEIGKNEVGKFLIIYDCIKKFPTSIGTFLLK